MLEQSALPGAVHEGPVSVHEAGLRGMITLRGDLSSRRLRKVCTEITGAAMPDVGAANCDGDRGLCWMSPDELLILVERDKVAEALGKIVDAMKDRHHLAVDVSDARAVFTVAGQGMREVLAKLTPADMHPDALSPGVMRRTRLGQVAAAFWLRDEETAEVICFRSVARYVFDLLSNAARSPLPGHLTRAGR